MVDLTTLEGISDWLFRVQLSVEACAGESVDEMYVLQDVIRAGSAGNFILKLEEESKGFQANLVARAFQLPTTAVLNAEEQKSLDSFWALVPKCHLCGSSCPELADIVDARFLLCHACDFWDSES